MECIKLTLKDADVLAKNFRKILDETERQYNKAVDDYKLMCAIRNAGEQSFQKALAGCLIYRKMCQEIKKEYTMYLELVTLGSEEYR